MHANETLPKHMTAALLTGHGGMDKLEIRDDVPVPTPGPNEVLIRVAAAGVNNTDINTRIGWYSKGVTQETGTGAASGFDTSEDEDAGWSGTALQFPRIQGADCCGRIVAVGEGVDAGRIGQRVIVRNMLRAPVDFRPFECWTYGSDCDGGFAQYTKVHTAEAYSVDCDWSDVELASVPCAYSTAEGMVHRAGIKAGEHVLVTGASGGVGSAAVQLAKRRGAIVTAIAGASKAARLKELGAQTVIPRGEKLSDHLADKSVDVVIDVVAGTQFPELLDVLKLGGRYAVAGAIGGPIVELDVRSLYLKDLTFFGCTFQENEIFENLISYIERGEIVPNVSGTYPLADIRQAQEEFMSKKTGGKLVLIIPQ